MLQFSSVMSIACSLIYCYFLCSPDDIDLEMQSLEMQRKLLCEFRLQEMSTIKCRYVDHLRELFFLQNNGNFMDYVSWRKRPNPQLANFLKISQLDSDDEDQDDYKYEAKVNNEVGSCDGYM